MCIVEQSDIKSLVVKEVFSSTIVFELNKMEYIVRPRSRAPVIFSKP